MSALVEDRNIPHSFPAIVILTQIRHQLGAGILPSMVFAISIIREQGWIA